MGRGRKGGRHGSMRKCEVDLPSLPISQFLPIVRWSRPRSALRSGGHPDPGERGHDGTESDHDDRHARAKQRVADQPRTLARAARIARPGAPGSAMPRRDHRDEPASRPARRRATAPVDGSRDGADDGRQQAEPDEHDPAGEAGRRDERPAALAAGQDPHRLGRARAWSARAGGPARPSGAAPPAPSRPGTPSHDRVLDRRDLLDQQADRRRRAPSRRDAVGQVGRGPDRFARDDHEPDVERGIVDGDRVEALAELEGHRARGRPRTTPSGRRARSCSRVRRKTSGRWASSSNSSSASIRPRTRT